MTLSLVTVASCMEAIPITRSEPVLAFGPLQTRILHHAKAHCWLFNRLLWLHL